MRRRALLLAGAGLLAAGCGSRPEAITTVTHTRTVRHVDPVPDRPPRPVHVQVTVVDGDTNTRVDGAHVRIGKHSARSDRHGVARIPLLRRRALVTVAEKPGYDGRAVRLPFRKRPKSTIRIYRRSLQWTMYGADARRTQAQPRLKIRPPFRVVWSRGLGSLIEFPAVVKDGVAYIANAQGTVTALDMRNGQVIWQHRTPNGKMASSPAVWRDVLVVHGMDGHISVLRRSDGGSLSAFSTTGRFLWRRDVGSYVYSSPAVWGGRVFFGAYSGVFYALRASNGATLWAHGTGGPISGAATVVDGVAYAGSFAHRILGVDARSGRIVLDFPHGEYVPVSGAGRRLLLHGYSRVFAVTRR